MEEVTRATFDDTLDALAHNQRRTLLVTLSKADSPVEIRDSKDGPYTAEQRVQMGHVHLPKLEKYGFVRWDQGRNEVSKGPNFGEVEPFLELLDEHGEKLLAGWV